MIGKFENFDTTLEKHQDYKTFLEHIDGLIIVDCNGTILIMDDSLARDCYVNGLQMNGKTVVGLNIMEVIPTTHIMKCFEEKTPKVADYYFVEGRTIVSTRRPLYKDGELIGAMEYDLFGIGGEFLTEFLTKTSELSKELADIKEGYKVAQQAKYTINAILGNSKSITKVKDEIRIASRHNSTVLIEGETGCGKELVAHAIHALSDRQLGQFIKVNCAAIPENLVESELFGYEDGSFTGGKRGGKKGKLALANGGTIFLDEINQLPLSAQPKLLRALQEHEVNPVGSEKNFPIDIRVIATSNEDLKMMVTSGRFRQDLYYRLNVINIKVPSLAERKEDIPGIVQGLINSLNIKLDKSVDGISPKALKLLSEYSWPGNIRELNNIIERAMNHCNKGLIKIIHFDGTSLTSMIDELRASDENEFNTLEQARDLAERRAILKALRKCYGNKVNAAKLLQISRSLIHKKISKFSIQENEYHE